MNNEIFNLEIKNCTITEESCTILKALIENLCKDNPNFRILIECCYFP
jgi:hypothetical protein